MKISTRGRYGIRALVDLASNNGECKNIKSIAKSQNLSEAYLEQLFMPLKKAGLIESTRGAQGGYTISRPLNKITAGEILEVLEGSLYPTDCLSGDDETGCGSHQCATCAAKELWAKLYKQSSDLLRSITLADLVSDYGVLLEQSDEDIWEEHEYEQNIHG